MACGCNKTSKTRTATMENGTVVTETSVGNDGKGAPGDKKGGPLDQCLFCAQKHADEALVAMNEFMYERENRSFVHGSLRAVVNHTFRRWANIAAKAREAALLWQEAKFAEANAVLTEVIALVDKEIRKENPEIDERIRETEDGEKKEE